MCVSTTCLFGKCLFQPFLQIFWKKYYHYVDGIHYRSKYLTSTFKLKSKFDQIVTLFNIFSNVSATCRCRESVSTTCQSFFQVVLRLWLVIGIQRISNVCSFDTEFKVIIKYIMRGFGEHNIISSNEFNKFSNEPARI